MLDSGDFALAAWLVNIDLVASYLVLFQLILQNCLQSIFSGYLFKFDLAVVKRLLRNAFVWYK